VNYLKISHVSKDIVEDIIKSLNAWFGKESPTTSGGKVLEYLGLTLDYTVKGHVKISMYDYVRKLVEEAPSDMGGVTKTPASGHLFMIDLDCNKLPKKMAQVFHHFEAK